MRNADGQTHGLADLLTAERMRAVQSARTHSRNLALACRHIGDARNFTQAARDFHSAKQLAADLRKGAAA